MGSRCWRGFCRSEAVEAGRAGTNTVYFTVEMEGRVPYSGFAHVVLTDDWRNEVEFTPETEAELRKSLDDAIRTFDLSRITLEDTNWVVPNPVKGKLKNFSTTVNGIVVDGIGYGTATIKKLGSFPITVE